MFTTARSLQNLSMRTTKSSMPTVPTMERLLQNSFRRQSNRGSTKERAAAILWQKSRKRQIGRNPKCAFELSTYLRQWPCRSTDWHCGALARHVRHSTLRFSTLPTTCTVMKVSAAWKTEASFLLQTFREGSRKIWIKAKSATERSLFASVTKIIQYDLQKIILTKWEIWAKMSF